MEFVRFRGQNRACGIFFGGKFPNVFLLVGNPMFFGGQNPIFVRGKASFLWEKSRFLERTSGFFNFVEILHLLRRNRGEWGDE